MGKGAQQVLCPPTVLSTREAVANVTNVGGGGGGGGGVKECLPNAVYLNVYDVLIPDDPGTIPRLNNVLLPCGMGIFHTGVQVWHREFAFGGHPDAESGIFEVGPRECPSVKFRTSLLLGFTKVSERDVEELVQFLGETEFVGNRYSLISRNCNSFSFRFAKLLGVHHRFPKWVNRLASVASNVTCILPEGMDQPVCDDDGADTPLIMEPQKPPRVAIL